MVGFKRAGERADVQRMRAFTSTLAITFALALGACGRSDIATDPGEGFVVRSYTLEGGDRVWVEALVEDDMVLRRAVLAIDDGLHLEALAAELAMGQEYELVLESSDEVLIVEIDEEPTAWIWL